MQNSSETDDGLTRRLWTPWRMQYVGGNATETGCIFCNRLASDDDTESLIVYRAVHCFAIMNLFPYNTGHIMLVPNEHVASPEDASNDALAEMAKLLPGVLRALRRVLACHGFNVGLNVGSVAGAGVAVHMHQHVVPRWNGDANFMPILSNTTVMPELIPVSHAKIRAELIRELDATRHETSTWILLDPEQMRVWLEPDGSLPVARIDRDVPVWRTSVNAAAERGFPAKIASWSSEPKQDAGSPVAVPLHLLHPGSDAARSLIAIDDALNRLSPADRQLVIAATGISR